VGGSAAIDVLTEGGPMKRRYPACFRMFYGVSPQLQCDFGGYVFLSDGRTAYEIVRP
jgi:hypothetical protein